MVLAAQCVPAAQVCKLPAQAFRMAAQLAATWNAAGRGDPAEAHITAYSGPAAEGALPYTLPALLSAPAWQPAADAVAQKLASLLDSPVGLITLGADEQQVYMTTACHMFHLVHVTHDMPAASEAWHLPMDVCTYIYRHFFLV